MNQLSYAQHGMWIAARAGAGTAYHMPLVIRLAEQPDHDALVKACHTLVERHPVLGSAVAEQDGTPRLVPAAELPALERAESLDEVVTRPFDLSTGPLIRFALTGTGTDNGSLAGPDTLVVVTHHLVFDGASKDVLVADLETLLSGGTPAELAYADHAATQHKRVAALLEEAGRFWDARPTEAQPTIVTGELLSSRGTAEGKLLEFPAVIPDLTGLTRFEVLVAALHTLLASYGNAEVVTALDLSTRPAEASGHIGCWVNELPLSSRPAAGTPFSGFADRLRAELREIYDYREVPLARAVPGLRPHAALAPISLSYRRLPDERSSLGEVEWLSFNHGVRGALQLQVAQGPDGALVSLRHDPRELADPTAFADDLTRLLAAVAEDPDRPLGDLVPFTTAPLPAATSLPPTAPLPDATPAVPAGAAAEAASDDPLVAQVRAIWEQVLDHAPIAPDDDIFDLGGHSLTITQIIARMEQQLGLEISLDDFFDNPTVAGVVAVIRG